MQIHRKTNLLMPTDKLSMQAELSTRAALGLAETYWLLKPSPNKCR